MRAHEPYPGYKNTLFRNVTSLALQRILVKCDAGNISTAIGSRYLAPGVKRISKYGRKKKGEKTHAHIRSNLNNKVVVFSEKDD